ncbi:BolA family protein [Neorhizobium sp. JUb45]|uniref:BolA family protein n=1 Tax=unclassified Neorhizobium TaxID=2629175 RepID=UPI0010517355|nr:BolA family protein [Neorhizobium sp. JUb45]TCR01146.1 BolA protein [Neorhizobium sp. JUb45]
MTVKARIETSLVHALQPERLDVIDESHQHAGHQPQFSGEGGSHMRVRIVSKAFEGKSRIERHRIINDILKPELQAGLHALAVEASAPGEPTRW